MACRAPLAPLVHAEAEREGAGARACPYAELYLIEVRLHTFHFMQTCGRA
jgi:hypothetical protein